MMNKNNYYGYGKEEELMTLEKPEKLTKENIIYYSEHYKSLNCPEGKARQIKARKFIEHNCIEWDRENKVWLCKPIKTYNKTTYHIKKTKEGFDCSCQFYVQTGKICSHQLALYLYLKLRNQKP